MISLSHRGLVSHTFHTLTKFGNFIFLLKCLCCCFPSCSVLYPSPFLWSYAIWYLNKSNLHNDMNVKAFTFYKPKKLLWQPHMSTDWSKQSRHFQFILYGRWTAACTSKSQVMFSYMQMRGKKTGGQQTDVSWMQWHLSELFKVLVDSVDKCHSCISLDLIMIWMYFACFLCSYVYDVWNLVKVFTLYVNTHTHNHGHD